MLKIYWNLRFQIIPNTLISYKSAHKYSFSNVSPFFQFLGAQRSGHISPWRNKTLHHLFRVPLSLALVIGKYSIEQWEYLELQKFSIGKMIYSFTKSFINSFIFTVWAYPCKLEVWILIACLLIGGNFVPSIKPWKLKNF